MSTSIDHDVGLRELDVMDPEGIARFEEAFYRGFDGARHNHLVRWLWEWDDAHQRLRTRVPYKDQRVWVATGGSHAGIGLAVNCRMALLQAEAFGFSLPGSLSGAGECCEILAFFSCETQGLAVFHAVWTKLFGALQAHGFRWAVATSAAKVLCLYRRMGARILDQRTVDGEARYFLEFNLARTARWNSRLDEARPTVQAGTSAASGLAVAAEDVGILLQRLLACMDVARGMECRAISLASLESGARRLEASARHRLAMAASEPDLQAEARHRAEELASLARLWEAVPAFARSVAANPFASSASLVEPLEFLLLTSVEAWEGSEESMETLEALLSADRQRALREIVEREVREGRDRGAMEGVVEAFCRVVESLKALGHEMRLGQPGWQRWRESKDGAMAGGTAPSRTRRE